MNWLYLIDHPFRDLPAYCWWAIHSKHHDSGADNIYLVSTAEFNLSDTINSHIDVIVWNYARPNNMHLIKRASKLGIRNVIHDTEGIPYNISSYFASLSKEDFAYIDELWLWGQYQLDHVLTILDTLLVRNVSAIVTGSIRYEYIKALPKVDIEKNTDNYLWNTNFPLISPLYQSAFEEFEQLYKVHKLYSKNDALELVINTSHLRTFSASYIQHLLALCGSSKIIIRPHPFESKDFYKSYFQNDTTRLIYSRGGDVHNDINICSLVLHSGCQTCLDSFIRGIPSFVFPQHYTNLWSKVSPVIRYSDLHKLSSNEFLRGSLDTQDALFRKHNVEKYVMNIYRDLDLSCSIIHALNEKSIKVRAFYYIFATKLRVKLSILLSFFYSIFRPSASSFKKEMKLDSSKIQACLSDTFNVPSRAIGNFISL